MWFIPDPARAHIRAQVTSGVLDEMAAVPAMLELYIQTLCDRAFHECQRKRYQFAEVEQGSHQEGGVALRKVFVDLPSPRSPPPKRLPLHTRSA
jgi:hypothetical protein